MYFSPDVTGRFSLYIIKSFCEIPSGKSFQCKDLLLLLWVSGQNCQSSIGSVLLQRFWDRKPSFDYYKGLFVSSLPLFPGE